MLVSTRFKKINSKLAVLEKAIEHLDSNESDVVSLKNSVELDLSKFNKLYIKFQSYNNQYFKGTQFNGKLGEIEESLEINTAKALDNFQEGENNKIKNDLIKSKNDKFYGIHAIEISNIVLAFCALLFLIINFNNGISFDHPFSLLLIALCVPLLTLITTNQLPRLFVGIISFFLIFYSLINLPTTQVINITDSLRANIKIPITIYDYYECGDNCMKYTDAELVRLKMALNNEAASIIKNRE
ncbi:hypothetical protein [Vibrio echinoideorum]|uniref:Uncharacterized protein n=1 Tax=Vibrio echinoideorum TaxID=2100116 RepID=A0ABU9FMF4_9VIBR